MRPGRSPKASGEPALTALAAAEADRARGPTSCSIPNSPGSARRAAWLREIEDRAGARFSGLGLIEEACDVSFPLEELITLVGLRQVWVACETHDVPVGMVIASVRNGAAHIEEMDVLPAYGRRGFGTLLLNQVCACARGPGASGRDSLHVSRCSLKRASQQQERLPGPAAKRVDFRHASNPRKRNTTWPCEAEARVFMRRELERHPLSRQLQVRVARQTGRPTRSSRSIGMV